MPARRSAAVVLYAYRHSYAQRLLMSAPHLMCFEN